MTEKDDNHYNDESRKELLALNNARFKSGRPDAGEVSYFMTFELPDLKKNLEEEFNSEKYSIERIEKVKQEYEKNWNEQPSRIKLCVDLVFFGLGQKVAQLARGALNISNMDDFNFYYDFHRGMSVVASGLKDVDRESVGQYEQHLSSTLFDMAEEGDLNPIEYVNFYLEEVRKTTDNLKILQEDVLGFLLADKIIDNIVKKDPKLVITYNAEPMEYVLAGARFAVDCYKQICGKVEPLYQTNSK
jgi:hypothetical protein